MQRTILRSFLVFSGFCPDVSYRCQSGDVDVNFSAQVRPNEICGRGISGGPNWHYECIPVGEQASGGATTSVFGEVASRYKFTGLSTNPNLVDHIGYIFQKNYRRGAVNAQLESLVVYVHLGDPERSLYVRSVEQGSVERRKISCEITH